MKLTLLGLIIGSALCGCANYEDNNANNVSNSDNQSPQLSNATYSSQSSSTLESSVMFQQQFQNKLSTHKGATFSNQKHNQYNGPISGSKLNINHYAKGLMQDLVANLQYVNSTTPLAVVSFVMLDSDYNQSSLLGNQMAESLMHEIHKFGIPVIDYKTTGFIRITEQGDFAFSKDYEELGESLAARYIVGGTMAKHKDGYLVNARVIGLQSKAVVASAQHFIPNEIANALMVNNKNSTILSSQTQNIKNETIKASANETQEFNQFISLIAK